jgi:hypothetical protein
LPFFVTAHLPSTCSIQWLCRRNERQISTSCSSPRNSSTISDSDMSFFIQFSTKIACFKPDSDKGSIRLSFGFLQSDVGSHLAHHCHDIQSIFFPSSSSRPSSI